MPKLKGYDLNNYKNREIPMPDYLYSYFEERILLTFGNNSSGYYVQRKYASYDLYSYWLNVKLSLFALKYYNVEFDYNKKNGKRTIRVNPEMIKFYDPYFIHEFAKKCGSVKSSGYLNIIFESDLAYENFKISFKNFINNLYEYYWFKD